MWVGAVRRGSRGRGRRLEPQRAKYYKVKDCTELMLCCYDLHFLFLLLYIDTPISELERNIRTPVLGVYMVMKMIRWLIGQRSLTTQPFVNLNRT
jgi:predicted kinase